MSAAQSLKDQVKYRLKLTRGPLAGQSFDFENPKLQIGRGSENGLVLLNDLKASRQHAEINWDGFELQIVNLSRKNYIIVNGSQVDTAKLESGSVIVIGDSEMRVEFDQEAKTQVLTEVPDEEPIGAFDPSEMAVEMKSTPLLQPTPAPHFPAMPNSNRAPEPYTVQTPASPNNRKSGSRSKRPRVNPGANSGRTRFYIIIVVIGAVFWWLMSSNAIKKKELTFKSTEQIEKDIELSREEVKEFEARREKLNNVQFKRAQENYIRGFRDYKQGNYGRARESFQVVLNLDPDNELAKRYYHLSKVKFDELMRFNMLQGNRYRDKKNWRLCKSSYFNVMTMLNNGQDPVFKEAKQYFDQCSLAEEGRY